MENRTPSLDLSDLLCSIECLRREMRDTATDPTPRMIHWGRLVLRRTHPTLTFKPGFEQLPLEQRWARVRAHLSPQLLKALLVNLRELQEKNRPIDLRTRLPETAAALGKDGETGSVCD